MPAVGRELGRYGVRVVWLQTTGLPEAIAAPVQPAYGTGATDGMTRAELIAWLQGSTMLNRLTSLAEIGNAAAFLASDLAGATTAASANLTCGQVPTR